ncbi:MAG: DUF948 domain-containing protein [Actinomycetales bacterium]|nr:DUF948 domain-containing protein [Actinomycetales bacterium]
MSEVVQWIGAIAGLLAAIGFIGLVGFLAVPLVKLGRTFDAATRSITEVTDHTVPVIDEAAGTVASTNVQLGKVDQITTSAAEISQNVSALTALVSATVGGPLIKLASFTYGVRRALADLAEKVRR